MRSPLPVDGVIDGFSEGLQLTAKTGVVRLCIPAAIGYGARASGPIPANSDLVFQVELVDFKTAAEIEDMRKAQAADAPPEEESAPKP
jgi:FKBP-type peptidyl-prolyl cis-trans isomerase FkpA